MSEPIVMQALCRTEISWSDEPGSKGLLITQADNLGGEDDGLWIPDCHVPAFIAAIQSVYAKK